MTVGQLPWLPHFWFAAFSLVACLVIGVYAWRHSGRAAMWAWPVAIAFGFVAALRGAPLDQPLVSFFTRVVVLLGILGLIGPVLSPLTAGVILRARRQMRVGNVVYLDGESLQVTETHSLYAAARDRQGREHRLGYPRLLRADLVISPHALLTAELPQVDESDRPWLKAWLAACPWAAHRLEPIVQRVPAGWRVELPLVELRSAGTAEDALRRAWDQRTV